MRVLLVPNTANQRAVSAAAELTTWLSGLGVEPVMAQGDAEVSGLGSIGVPASDLGAPVLAIALGGDGTMLKAFHLLGDAEAPLLGIKFGRLGFLSGASGDNMRPAIECALAGEAKIERRATLRAEVTMDGRIAGTYRALNEVVLSRGATGRVVALDLSIDGHAVSSYSADGVIVATATGSTAYALSAGGPVVSPGFGGMVIVPVAPHTLKARAIVTGPSDMVEVSLLDPARAEACFIVDGESAPCRRSIDKIVVSRGAHDVSLVKYHGRDFYDTVGEVFF